MNKVYKQHKEAFWGRIEALKAQIKAVASDIAWRDKRNQWPDRMTRGTAIVNNIALNNELKRMVG